MSSSSPPPLYLVQVYTSDGGSGGGDANTDRLRRIRAVAAPPRLTSLTADTPGQHCSAAAADPPVMFDMEVSNAVSTGTLLLRFMEYVSEARALLTYRGARYVWPLLVQEMRRQRVGPVKAAVPQLLLDSYIGGGGGDLEELMAWTPAEMQQCVETNLKRILVAVPNLQTLETRQMSVNTAVVASVDAFRASAMF